MCGVMPVVGNGRGIVVENKRSYILRFAFVSESIVIGFTCAAKLRLMGSHKNERTRT